MVNPSVTRIHHLTIMVTSAIPGLEAGRVAVAVTLSKGRGERLELETADVLSLFEQCGALIATPAGARVR
jgi:hypothetical protein